MQYRTLVLCRIIDNFGDAGVAWRFARQLAAEHHWQIDLAIDQPQVLDRLGAAGRTFPGGGQVRVRPWRQDTSFDPAAIDIVVSAFGAELPAGVRGALAGGARRPLWVQLEYLSAEEWVARHHGARSPKPADGAVEHFYYPGFDEDTGGLLREAGLFAQRDAFVDSPGQDRWLAAHDIPRRQDERLATLFCYPQAPVPSWFDLLAADAQRWRVLIPDGVAEDPVRRWIETRRPAATGASAAGTRTLQSGSLTLQRIPFLGQDDYDRLLWSADLNIVRGEDSWVRAQWAGRPFLWQPYRQAQARHLVKLDAFLQKMRAGTLTRDAMSAWSGRGDWNAAWKTFASGFERVRQDHARWSMALGAQTGLCSRFMEFCRQRL